MNVVKKIKIAGSGCQFFFVFFFFFEVAQKCLKKWFYASKQDRQLSK